jgi:hypothetical protein
MRQQKPKNRKFKNKQRPNNRRGRNNSRPNGVSRTSGVRHDPLLKLLADFRADMNNTTLWKVVTLLEHEAEVGIKYLGVERAVLRALKGEKVENQELLIARIQKVAA